MRISDWSSDVCSSDLKAAHQRVVLSRSAAQRVRQRGVDLGKQGGRWGITADFRAHRLQQSFSRLPHLPGQAVGGMAQVRDICPRAQPAKQPHTFIRFAGGLQPCRRSEEHTYELQSLMRHAYAVFCLKKKN